MYLLIYIFLLVISIMMIYRSYQMAHKLSELHMGEKAIALSPFQYKVLYGNDYKSVSLLSVIYQCIATVPYILIQPFYFMCYLWISGKVHMPYYITMDIILYVFMISNGYVLIVDILFESIKNVAKPHDNIETTFALYMPWKFLLLDISIATIIITSMLCFEGYWNYALINIIIVLLLICIIAIGVRFTDKYSMNLEQLCGINGTFIRYKDIVKITVFERTLFWGLEKQTRIKIEDKNNMYYPDFTPKSPKEFINCLKKKCPNVEYIILDK